MNEEKVKTNKWTPEYNKAYKDNYNKLHRKAVREANNTKTECPECHSVINVSSYKRHIKTVFHKTRCCDPLSKEEIIKALLLKVV